MKPLRVLHVLAAWVAPAALDSETICRCRFALTRWNMGGYDVLVVSGGIFRVGQVRSAGDMMADWFNEVGVSLDRIVIDRASVDTFENVEEAVALLHQKYPGHPLRIDVVSNPLHSVRAFVTYWRHLGIHVRPRPTWYWTGLRQIAFEIILIFLAATFDPHARILAGVRHQRRHSPN